MKYRLILALIILSVPQSAFAWKQAFIEALKNGGAYVESNRGEVLFDHRSQDHFIPASTIKIATAACTIKELGIDYRFPTDFLITPDNELVIRGYGDPFLISEELDLMAKGLVDRGLKKVSSIIIDSSYFGSDIGIDGQSASTNPYDALNGALVANFNTIYFHKRGNKIESAEPQTPITPLAKEIGKKYANGKHRVNLGKDPQRNSRYLSELIAEFLKKYGVVVSAPLSLKIETAPPHANLIYRHRSSKTVSDAVRGMLKFSTNFVANQLFLVLGAKQHGTPATTKKGQEALRSCLLNHIGWKNFEIYEGAGLSRKNRVSPQQMMILLRMFEPYRDLLPLEKGIFQAKTGTLRGVNTLAGYFKHDDGRLIRFVILVNSPVPYDYKFRLAEQLRRGLH
jgi:D-alanyl-D-alanine carboxypeptidase/D-alanyl-D-alanine-endopeptidase (penicillin-binding protein 4)